MHEYGRHSRSNRKNPQPSAKMTKLAKLYLTQRGLVSLASVSKLSGAKQELKQRPLIGPLGTELRLCLSVWHCAGLS